MTSVCAVRNPRTGEADYRVRLARPDEVAREVEYLRRNQEGWMQSGMQGRSEFLSAFADALDRRAPEMLDALMRDTGRYRESMAEIEGSIALVRTWAAQAPILLNGSCRPSATSPIIIHPHTVPYPVVGVISPWNFPLLLSLMDSIVALAAGCAVLVKPSEVTPRFVEPLLEVIADAGMQDVMRVLTGDGVAGAALCGEADMLCLTGSLETGRKVSEVAGRRMIPASLELGGKDAAIVFADADLDHAAKAVCWGGFTNAGQACQAIERVYVEAPAFGAFSSHLIDYAKRLTLNDRDIRTGEIGPVIAASQVEIIQGQLEDALNKGARPVLGGKLHESGGYWCPPSILVDVDHSMDLMRKETFATILPIMPFGNETEALELANDSIFGLSGAVFSRDTRRALRIARQIEAGAISVNDCALTTRVFDGEKNAFKGSGLGISRMGKASVLRFVRQRALLENPEKTINDWWFPLLRA